MAVDDWRWMDEYGIGSMSYYIWPAKARDFTALT